MEGGDGMVAMVRGCGQAGLSVTLFDGGRKYTLMPNQTVNLNSSSQQSSSQNVPTTQPVVRNPTVIHQPMTNAPNNPAMTNPMMTNPMMSNPMTTNPMMVQQQMHQLVKPQPINHHGHCPQQAVLPHNMDRHNSHHSTMTNTDQDKRDISAQVTDGRYTTVYKMQHCNASPTSPPVQVTEFPPQRATLVPGHGNFQVGGVGSQAEYTPSTIQNTYHGAMVWSDRGAVYSPRSSRQLDSFASSLRKYPALSPDRTTDVMERLANCNKNLKQKLVSHLPPYHQQGTEAIPRTFRDQIRYEECRRLENELSSIKEDTMRSEYEYMKCRTYGRMPDIPPSNKGCSERKNKDSSNNSYCSAMPKENQGALLERATKKDNSAPRLPMSKDNIAVPPSPTASQLSAAAVPTQDINSYSTAVENMNSISIQTLYTPYTALRQKKSVGTTSSSIEFSKCSCHFDTRKTKSEEDINDRDAEKKLYRWFSTIDDDLDGKIIKAKTVLKLKKNISEWGECLKKGIQHVICYKDDSWYSDSNDSSIPVNDKNDGGEESGIEEVVGYMLDKINNSKEIQAQNLQRETVNKLGLKLKEIVQKCKRKKQQTIKDDLLKALYELPLDVSQTTKKVYLEGLASSLTEKMQNVVEQDAEAVLSEGGDVQPTVTDTLPTRDSNHKESDRPKLRSETFVVLPTQVIKTNDYPTIMKRPSYATLNTRADDIKANLVIYIRQLSAKVYEWLECIKNEIPDIEEAKLADAVKNLAEDIVDRLKYRELSAIQSIRTSNENDLENLKYQIFKWINRYVGEDNLTTLQRAPDLMKKIKTVPIPNVLQSSKTLQYDADSDSSNCMLGDRFNKKDLMEKVSEVLPIFKTQNAGNFATKSIPVSRQNELKKCGTFVKEPSQSLANNARYVNIANMSTAQTSGARCCSEIPPVSSPEILINKINDEYFEYLDGWLQSIPIPCTNDSDRELGNKARMGIGNAFLQSLYSLSLDPAKLSNRFYYEDVLEDVLDDLLNELPQIPELVKMRPLLKCQLIEKTIATYELMYKIRDNVSYQQQFVHTVLAMIPHRRRSHERLSDEMEICSFVDEFILSVRYQNDDPDRSKWHRDRAYNKIQAFVEELHRYGKIGDDKTRWTLEIMRALDKVPAPCEEILKEEVDRIKLEEEIEDWYLSLPVIDNEEVYERIRRKNLKATLVKKIFDMDREINLGDCAGQRELKYEISRFIQKLPLRQDGNLNMNILINTLLTKLKTRTRQREYEHHSRKSVSFDDVFPPPPCCQQNQNFHASTINHHTLGSPHAPYIDETVNYTQFEDNVPKNSSYNEDNIIDENIDMQFYSIAEDPVPQDKKHSRSHISNSPMAVTDDSKIYTFHDSGSTSAKQMLRQNTTDSRRTSHQSYHVPHQCCINKSQGWHESLQTSTPAGPASANRTNQPTPAKPNATGPTIPQTQKAYYNNGGLHTSQLPGPSAPRTPFYNDSLDTSSTSYFKPHGPTCCEQPHCFKSKGLASQPQAATPRQVIDAALARQPLKATQDKPAPQPSFQYSKAAGVSQVSALSGSVGSVSDNVNPNAIIEDARVVQRCVNQPATFNQCTPSQTAQQPQRGKVPSQVPYQAPCNPTQYTPCNPTQYTPCNPTQYTPCNPTQYTPCNPTQFTPCQRPVQMGSQRLSATQLQPVSSQMRQSITSQNYEGLSQIQPSSTSQIMRQSSQTGSQMNVTNTGRPSLCFPWCTTCTDLPSNRKCNKNDKSCLMPGCDNPKCKVPRNKRRKIQQLQLQLRKMYECGGMLDGTGSNFNYECTTNSSVNQNYRCRCMEFYIKKCKKARKCNYPYTDRSGAVLEIPPCLALQSPHPCFL